jgi:hypothetical protein
MVSFEQRHEDSLGGLGFVCERLCSDFEPANLLRANIVFLKEIINSYMISWKPVKAKELAS